MKELSAFKVGEKNDAFAKYFIGQSYLNMLNTEQIKIANVGIGESNPCCLSP